MNKFFKFSYVLSLFCSRMVLFMKSNHVLNIAVLKIYVYISRAHHQTLTSCGAKEISRGHILTTVNQLLFASKKFCAFSEYLVSLNISRRELVLVVYNFITTLILISLVANMRRSDSVFRWLIAE